MDAWVPLALGTIKFIVLGTCCFFAIKSHRDGARKEKAEEKEREEKDEGIAVSQPPRLAPTVFVVEQPGFIWPNFSNRSHL